MDTLWLLKLYVTLRIRGVHIWLLHEVNILMGLSFNEKPRMYTSFKNFNLNLKYSSIIEHTATMTI